MTAFEVCRVVQHVDLRVARRHHGEITTVIAELADDAGVTSPWTPHDPTVTLIRALARLTMRSPEATSEGAADLCRHLRSDDADVPATSRSREVLS